MPFKLAIITFTFLSFNAFSQTLYTSCLGVVCSDSSETCSCDQTTQCVNDGTQTLETGEIKSLPYSFSRRVDRGCYGQTTYSLNISSVESIPITVTFMGQSHELDTLPHNGLSGTYTVGRTQTINSNICYCR